MEQYKDFHLTASSDLNTIIEKWQQSLLSERRLSELTGSSYLIDLKELFLFYPTISKKQFQRNV